MEGGKRVVEPAHKAKTKEFRDNYDRIFRKSLTSDEFMERNGVKRRVGLEDIREFEKKGWKRVK